jgi:hypothetical protein
MDSYSILSDWCRGAALDAGTSLVEDHYWGFYAENRAAETSWFAWFATLEDMLRYFADCWPFDYHGSPEDLEGGMLRAARFGVAVQRFAADEIDEDLFLALLSEAHLEVTVHWLGTLSQLLDGDGSFVREWRATFRGKDITTGGHAIEDDELSEVLQVLAWG